MDFDFQIGDLILYKNNQLIAFNKPPGIPVQQDKSGDKSLLGLGEIYCKSKLQLIHRIDRPASGIVLLAKNNPALNELNRQFKEREVDKTYLAVVGNKPAEESGKLVHFLRRNGRINRTETYTEEQPESRKAELTYRLIASIERYHLLEIKLHSGRHHQIRAQLAAIGSPIKGDDKYGFKRANRDRSIQLHAWKLGFTHPVSHEKEIIIAPPPKDPVWDAFGALVNLGE
ncbi:MAG: RNA pseudouridine synthase [Saprospiraceae bacterium]|nr:MAG: RNA pseudouridine synthase [Saprospiraceae bacterium]